MPVISKRFNAVTALMFALIWSTEFVEPIAYLDFGMMSDALYPPSTPQMMAEVISAILKALVNIVFS